MIVNDLITRVVNTLTVTKILLFKLQSTYVEKYLPDVKNWRGS